MDLYVTRSRVLIGLKKLVFADFSLFFLGIKFSYDSFDIVGAVIFQQHCSRVEKKRMFISNANYLLATEFLHFLFQQRAVVLVSESNLKSRLSIQTPIYQSH